MPKIDRVLISVFVLLATLLIAVPALAESEIGSSASFPQACSAIASLSDVPAAAQRVTDNAGNRYVVGYRQVSGVNQNAIIAAFDSGGGKRWCRDDYETGGPDSRGYGLLWTGSALYALFSVDGGDSSGFDALADGWLKYYTDSSTGGGGPQVAVIVQVDPASGNPLHGAFLTARLPSTGKINSLAVTDMCWVNDALRVEADSWYAPRRVNKSAMPACSGSSPLDYVVSLPADLSQALAVSSHACGEVDVAIAAGCPTSFIYLPLIIKAP